jgi:HSP20 family protein
MYGTTLATRFSPRNANPFGTLSTLNRVVEEFLGDYAHTHDGTDANRAWQPPVDIVETEQAYEVRAELPGIPKEDVHLSLDNNILTLSGERKLEKDVDHGSFHRIERAYGTFSRSFTLPARVSADRVEAKYDNGLLTVVIPKAEEAKPRRIEIG